ncbi:tetratricopeptide repeat protein, partial [Bdellovibrionota bacterium FG-2]
CPPQALNPLPRLQGYQLLNPLALLTPECDIKRMKNLRTVSFCLALCLILSGCLKTRTQIKEEGGDETAKPVAAPIQDVQPQGQYVIDEIKSEITRLTGRIEDLERTQKQGAETANQAQKEDQKKLETRVVELEKAQALLIENFKTAEETSLNKDPEELYTKASTQLEAGTLDTAIETLSTYLNHPKAKKIQEATFQRAEAYYQLKQYKKAIVDYSKFPEKFPRSHHNPEALYKIGLSFEALGMKDDAKGFFQELAEKFPKSSEAKKVRSKLK